MANSVDSGSITGTSVDSRLRVLLESVLLFGVPGFLIWVGTRFGGANLVERGWHPGWAFILFLYGPFLALVPLTFLLVGRERGLLDTSPNRWHRLGFVRPNKSIWKTMIVFVVGVQLAEGILSQLIDLPAIFPLLSPPSHIPSPFNGEVELPLTEFLGFETTGTWWLIGLWVILLFINIMGEEMAWRGYLLPRQEAAFGRYAWILNGLLWCFVLHFFMPWQWLAILPSNLATPYLAQKYKSIWPGVILHGIGNALVFLVLIPGVAR